MKYNSYSSRDREYPLFISKFSSLIEMVRITT